MHIFVLVIKRRNPTNLVMRMRISIAIFLSCSDTEPHPWAKYMVPDPVYVGRGVEGVVDPAAVVLVDQERDVLLVVPEQQVKDLLSEDMSRREEGQWIRTIF